MTSTDAKCAGNSGKIKVNISNYKNNLLDICTCKHKKNNAEYCTNKSPSTKIYIFHVSGNYPE